MAPFFPYWNLNLQMLAAQQQAAVLAQMSPRMRETALQQMQQSGDGGDSWTHGGDDEDEEDEEEHDNKSVDSAMDLSQGTPTKDDEQQQTTPDFAMNLKLESEQHTNDTPLLSSMSASRRKGRVLKLDSLLQAKSEAQTPDSQQQKSQIKNNNNNELPLASSPINVAAKIEDPSSADESMEVPCPIANGQNSANTSASSTASSSGNSSNSSNVSSSTGPTVVASTTTATANGSSASSSGNSSAANSPQANGAIYECKYCDIYFKDAVLYTIHMGYHSCDDVFKCNMCGEKCDGPVGLFVHMARNAHS